MKKTVVLLAFAFIFCTITCSCKKNTPPSSNGASLSQTPPTSQSSSQSNVSEIDANTLLNVPKQVELPKKGDNYQLEPYYEKNSEIKFEFLSSVESMVTIDETGLITYLDQENQASGLVEVYVTTKPTPNDKTIVAIVNVYAGVPLAKQ